MIDSKGRLSTDGSQSPLKHMQSANAGASRRNAHGSQGNKRKSGNGGVYPSLSGTTPQSNATTLANGGTMMEEVKSKSRRQQHYPSSSSKTPISDGFSGATGSQHLDENASENMPNVQSALQGVDQSSEEEDTSPMIYDNN